MLVDDDPDVLESLAVLLQLEGFDVKAATTGQAALDLAAHFQSQVVLLEHGRSGTGGARHMPGQSL